MTLLATANSAGAVITTNNSGFLLLSTSALQTINWFSLAIGFCLNDVPGSSEFTNPFERYRLVGVDVVLTPANTYSAAPTLAGNGAAFGMIHSVVDYNDYGVPAASQAGIAALRERPSYRTQNLFSGRPYQWFVKPRVAMPAYAAGAFTAYANMASPWVDTISPDVQHYGIKYVFEMANSTAAVQYCNMKLEVRYHLEFTDTR